MDYSNGASLGFFNIQAHQFDTQALEQIGIHPSILPETNESASLAGYYNQTIPVYSAIGDNQASFLGSVHKVNVSIHITVGTSSQLSVYSEKYVRVEPLDTRPFPGGGYILVGAALCGGRSFAMLKAFFEDTFHFFGINPAYVPDIYKQMLYAAYDTASKDLPVIETLFDGTRTEPWKRGAFTNISTSNFTPANLILGFLKGISTELYDFYNLIPEEIKQHKTILVGSGNGIKRNPLLVKAFEEQFNGKLTLSEHEEEAAFGACLCGIVGTGIQKTFIESK
jgi:sedoheptulokinase